MKRILLITAIAFSGLLLQSQTVSLKGVSLGGVFEDDNPFVNEKGTKFFETTVAGYNGEILIIESDFSDTIVGLGFETTGAYIIRDDFEIFKAAVQKNYDIELKQYEDTDTYSARKGKIFYMLLFVDMRDSGYAGAVNGYSIGFFITDEGLEEKDEQKRKDKAAEDF